MPLLHDRFQIRPFIPIMAYAVIIFIWGLADAIMSYAAPVYLEELLQSPGKMGLLVSTSSLAGLIFDYFCTKFIKIKVFYVFLWLALAMMLFFPGTFLFLPPRIGFFVLAMFLWGIYYELIAFANYRYIHHTVGPRFHAQSWGILSAFKSIAYMLGPLIAGFLYDLYAKLPFAAAFNLVIACALALFIFLQAAPSESKKTLESFQAKSVPVSEIKIWELLLHRIWPLWLFVFALFLIDATFWTIGAVLSENLKQTTPLGGLLLTMYEIPTLFVGWLAGRVARPFGKKRTAFVMAILDGTILIFAGQIKSVPILLLLVFCSAFCVSFSIPEIMAVFEDYVARLKLFSQEMINIERSAENMAYTLGPAVAGILAGIVGYQPTFSLMGGFLILVSALAFLVVPRKIRLPQQELETVAAVKHA